MLKEETKLYTLRFRRNEGQFVDFVVFIIIYTLPFRYF